MVTIRLEADWGLPPYYVDEGDGPFELYEADDFAERFALPEHVIRALDDVGSALPAHPEVGRPRQLGLRRPGRTSRHFYEQGRVVSRLLRRHVPADVRIKYVGDGNIPAEYY